MFLKGIHDMEIKTERLIIKPMGMEFLGSTHKYASDIDNTKFMFSLPSDSIEDTKAFLKYCEEEWKKEKPADCEFALIKDGVHIGGVGFSLNEEYDTANIGWILNPDYHKCGYASEAAIAVINYAKEHLNIHHIIATCDTENSASENVMKRIGFTKVDCYGGRKNKSSDEERQEYLYELFV